MRANFISRKFNLGEVENGLVVPEDVVPFVEPEYENDLTGVHLGGKNLVIEHIRSRVNHFELRVEHVIIGHIVEVKPYPLIVGLVDITPHIVEKHDRNPIIHEIVLFDVIPNHRLFQSHSPIELLELVIFLWSAFPISDRVFEE